MSDDRIDGVVQQGFGHIQDAAGGLTGDAGIQTSGKINEVAGALKNTYGQVKDKAGEAVGEAADQARGVYDRMSDELRDKPLLGIGIGVGLGFAIGMLVRGPQKVFYR